MISRFAAYCIDTFYRASDVCGEGVGRQQQAATEGSAAQAPGTRPL